MSSSYSGPYQSRIFNFIVHQYREVADKCDRGFRHLKFAATNTAQLILYPAYVLFQTARFSINKLQNKAVEDIPKFDEFAKDKSEIFADANIPIKPVLEFATTLVEANYSRVKNENQEGKNHIIRRKLSEIKRVKIEHSSAAVANSEIQGIASKLDSRELVLVGAENQILEMLTIEQQEKLHRRIILEVVSYLRDRRSQEITQKPQPLLKSCAETVPVFGPTRNFWQLMAWLEKSPIAIKANLFQESNLVSALEANMKNYTAASLVVANQQTKGALVKVDSLDLPPHISHQSPDSIAPISEKSFFLLIDRAIASLEQGHFPQGMESPQSESLFPGAEILPGNLFENFLDRYWYPIAPLFGLSGLAPSLDSEELIDPGEGGSALTEYSVPPVFDKLVVARQNPEMGTQGSPGDLIHQEKNEVFSTELTPFVGSMEEVSEISRQDGKYREEVSEISRQDGEYREDCWETEAVSVTYIKHPLEQLLEWLDRAMLWLEEAILQGGKWLERQWQKVKKGGIEKK